VSRFDRSHALEAGACFACAVAAAAVVYAATALVGGTLIHSGRPAAIEAGFALQHAIGINEAIRWADARGHDDLLALLMTIGDGVPLPG
jgi:hypothetical protein